MTTTEQSASRKKTLLLSGLLLFVASIATAWIFFTEPTATRGGATKETAMLVEVTRAERGTFRPVFVVTGTVRPAEDIVLAPRVGGRVVAHAPDFVPGGFVEKGKTLVRIDAADFRNSLRQRQSDLSQAVAELDLEMGRQNIARHEYEELIEGELSPEARKLMLRRPQLNAARMRVEAARAAVNQAQLELARTTVEAPFDGQVLTRDVNVGSQVAAGDALGRLVGVDEYWVVASLPLARLRWLTFPAAGSAPPAGSEAAPGSRVLVRNRTAWPPGVHREGRLFKLVGALDEQTRMARVLATVRDPLVRSGESNAPRLLIGEFLETRIVGNEVAGVVRLKRDYVRKDDTVWIVENDRLRIRELDVVVSDAEYAYASSGLGEADQVVTTNLATVVEGARLRVASKDPP